MSPQILVLVILYTPRSLNAMSLSPKVHENLDSKEGWIQADPLSSLQTLSESSRQ